MNITGAIFHRSFEKAYLKKDKKIRAAFDERFELFRRDTFHPLLNNHPLHGEWEGHRSINITGDLRAIFKVEGETAVFVAVDTHTNLYD